MIYDFKLFTECLENKLSEGLDVRGLNLTSTDCEVLEIVINVLWQICINKGDFGKYNFFILS